MNKSIRKDIQGLRAVAVIAVVVFHAKVFVDSGYLGVDIFFVISGFVISSSLLREFQLSGDIDLRAFYARRVRRLVPAVTLMVCVTVIGGFLILSPITEQPVTWKTAVAVPIFVANFAIALTSGDYFDLASEANPLLHTWSLSVEEQFYLIFPSILLILLKISHRKGKRFFPIAIGFLTAGTFMLLGVGISANSHFGVENFYNSGLRFWQFMLGAAVALVPLRISFGWVSKSLQLLGAVLVFFALWRESSSNLFPTSSAFFVTLGTVLLIAVPNLNTAINKILESRVMSRVGDYSYSIYLWHWPFIVFAHSLFPYLTYARSIAATVSIIPAYLSFKFLEEPIRMKKRLRHWSGQKLFLVCGSAAVSCTLFFTGVTEKFVLPHLNSTVHSSALIGDIGHEQYHKFVAQNFFPCEPLEIRDKAMKWNEYLRCQQSIAGLPQDVALVGDSHVEHLFPGLASRYPNVNFVYFQRSALPIESEGMSDIIDYVATSKSIKVVLLAASWQTRGFPVDQIETTVNTFQASGKEVFITDDVPHFEFEPSQCKFSVSLFSHSHRCEISKEYNEQLYSSFSSKLDFIAQKYPTLHLIRTNSSFCNIQECSMRRGHEILFRDQTHLNLLGSKFLASVIAKNSDFERAMKEIIEAK